MGWNCASRGRVGSISRAYPRASYVGCESAGRYIFVLVCGRNWADGGRLRLSLLSLSVYKAPCGLGTCEQIRVDGACWYGDGGVSCLPDLAGAEAHGTYVWNAGDCRDFASDSCVVCFTRIEESRWPARRRLTNRWSGRVQDKVPSSYVGVRAAQLKR